MNRTYTRLMLLIAALACGLLACSTGAQLGGTPPLPGAGTVLPAPPAANPSPGAPVLLQGQDAGRSVTLRVGQGLDLRLRDRQWSLPVFDAKVLAPAPMNEMLIRGVSGWNYRALAPGTTTLRTEGACVPSTSGVSCHSILVYQVTITVTP